MSKYKSAIEKIVVSEATFQNSTQREIVPSWINFFYGNNGSGKTTISRMIRNGQGLTLTTHPTTTYRLTKKCLR